MKTKEIFDKLKIMHSEPKCELNYNSEFELLVAVILSAQCTDKRVNKVTQKLFAVANTPQAIIGLGIDKLKQYIFSCGFYENKANNIIATAHMIIDEFNGNVPNTLDDLIKLPGVGRKTANVMLANVFNVPAIAVDTHVFRVSNRIGLVNAKTPLEVEKQLMQAIPRDEWSLAHHLLIHQGRYICKSLCPNCEECLLHEYCKFYLQSRR